MTSEDLGRLWGVLRSQLATLSVQNIRTTAGAAGFDVSLVPATSEARTGMGSRAEVLPALDKLFIAMAVETKIRVLSSLGNRLLATGSTGEQTLLLLTEQGFEVVNNIIAIETRSEANVDHLTALRNRRAFESDLTKSLAAATKSGEPIALLVFDIDKFKNVNDDHSGHATGDQALVAVAQIAAKCVARKGAAYRLGGDEFAAVLPNHTIQEALAVGERIRSTVNEAKVTSHNLTLSLSIGVAGCPAHGEDAASLMESADKAAYDAKDLGRNLVRVFGEAPPTVIGPREPIRREPAPGGLTDEQRRKIRLEYFRNRTARCPHDDVLLEVQDTTGLGQQTNSIYVSCPFCGLSEELD